MVLAAAALLVCSVAAGAEEAVAAKLDEGLATGGEGRRAVFVRMADQLVRKGGDYEAFCRKHAQDKRSDMRTLVLKTLRSKSESSWEAIAKLVRQLGRDGEIGDVKRFWIVNGFACDATERACRALAALDGVAFVYLQRGPILQHRRPARRPTASPKQLKDAYERVLKAWKDDTDEPFSTDGLTVPWNLKRIGADVAWAKEHATGKGVVVALFDTGLLPAEGLIRALWKNPAETLNGKDDDGNGYVDDVFGYDFTSGTFHVLGDPRPLSHGSMCAGIVAGRPINDKKIITGVAPRARVMILRGMGYLAAYEYALANGADVVSMSYMWVRTKLGHYRGLYRTAHEHLGAGGVVCVGGAGNFARLPEGRQIALPKDIPCVIAAAGILEDGSRAPASSKGPCHWTGVKFYDDYPRDRPLIKPDVTGCFGGYPVWSRDVAFRGRIKKVCAAGKGFALIVGPGGNSFAGPHAAGVAALMLSVNPELNAWSVKELMERTCKDIGQKGRDTSFGAGLLQAPQAVRAAAKLRIIGKTGRRAKQMRSP